MEELVSAKIRGHAINPATAAWLTEISDVLYGRLVKVGLVGPRSKAPVVTLGQFTADYIESRRADAKPRTIINLPYCRKELIGHFGEDRALRNITSADAIEFRAGMLFQNLRSSREIELSETFPWFTVCTWIGHTREVAREHYMSVPAEHIARAIAGERAPSGGEKTARPAAQSVHAEPCRTSQEPEGEDYETAFFGQEQGVAAPCEHTEPQPIPPRGVEPLSPG